MALGEMDLRRLETLESLARSWAPDHFQTITRDCECGKCECCGDSCDCYESLQDLMDRNEQSLILAMRDALPDLIALARRALEVS